MSKILYNPKTGSSIHGFVWSHAKWDLKVNEMKKFPDDVARGILKHHHFLMEVTADNLKVVKGMMEKKELKCKYCEFETNTKIALLNHEKTHGIGEEESEFMKGIEEARPKGGDYRPEGKKIMSPEEESGIPKSGKDKEGVEWYGPGTERDTVD